jgi:hypothetical protein
VKVGGRPITLMESTAWRLLESADLESFNVPALLAAGESAGVRYRIHAPLPEGPHRRPPMEPRRLWRIIDEYQEVLGDLPPPEWPSGNARTYPFHGDLQVVNVRVSEDGQWWVFDWGGVSWGPRLGDELNYWASEFESRFRPEPRRYLVRVSRLLGERGSEDEVVEAARYLGSMPTNSFRAELYAGVEDAVLTR